jgi:hypothetical protein
LPNVLATCFFLRVPSRLFTGGRAGHYSGFLPDDSENQLAAAGGPKPRPVSVAFAKVSPEFSAQRHRHEANAETGGGVDFVSWDAWMAEAASQISISPRILGSLEAERLFDLRWAATVVEQALRRLREECEGKGRLRLFEGLRDYLAAEHADISYANLAVSLGIAETVVKKQLHNLRQRYRWLLRDEVAHTVANPADVDDEIRHLCVALAAEA